MKRNLKQTMDNTPNAKYKVVEVTKDYYKLENGDIFEHTFDIDDDCCFGPSRFSILELNG